jgi:hypothetical protein
MRCDTTPANVSVVILVTETVLDSEEMVNRHDNRLTAPTIARPRAHVREAHANRATVGSSVLRERGTAGPFVRAS